MTAYIIDIFNHKSALIDIDTPEGNREAIINAPPQNKSNFKHKSNISIICWNIRGTHNKIFDQETQKLLFTNDVIMLTETHTDKSSEKIYNTIPGFIYKDYPRKYIHPNAPGPSGGIGIYVNANISDGIVFDCIDESIVLLSLKSSFFGWENDVLVACVYFSPADSSYIHSTNIRTDYFNILSEQNIKFSNYNDIFICGDLNARTGHTQDYQLVIPGSDGGINHIINENTNVIDSNVDIVEKRYSRDNVTNEYGRQLNNFCKNTGYRIMNGRLGDTKNTGDFTCYKENGASVVDYLLCKPKSMSIIKNFTIAPKQVASDHRPLQFILTHPVRIEENTVLSGDNLKSYKWDISKLEEYKINLNSLVCIEKKDQLLTDIINPNMSSNEISDNFYDLINTAISATFQEKKNTTKSLFPTNKWFNNECKIAKREVNNYSKIHDISRPPHSGIYHKLEQDYNRVKQKFQRQYRENIRLTLQDFHSDRPDAYWKLWNSLTPPQVNNSKLTLNQFEQYFKEQVNPPPTHYFDEIHMKEIRKFVESFNKTPNKIPTDENSVLTNDICNSPITIDEIQTHLRKLKNRKAAGADGISGEFLKHVSDDMAPMLYTLYNSILEKGEWPTKWAEGIITPVHKKACINKPDNYRKITVMPALGKVLESILNARLVYRNLTLEMDDPCQFGFKANARTSDNLFILQSILNRQKFKNKPLYVCFVDFTKAFDYVNRYALYHKLIKRGIQGKLLNLICDMYKKAKCRVKWKSRVGTEIDSEYGVLQGGMLSPKLFTEFLTDLKSYLEQKCGILIDDNILTYILYADDLILCSDSAEGLQKLIDGLFEFCRKWHLIVSLAKTNVLIFGKKKPQDVFMFNGSEIKITTEYKYVGTIISTKTRDIFSKNQDHLAEKCRNAIYALKAHSKNTIGDLPPILATKMFDSQILPIMQYTAEVWFQNKVTPELEKIHLAYLKNTMRVKPSSSTYATYSEFGRFPLIIKQKCQMIKYWKRILDMNRKYITKKAYNSMLELNDLGQSNWCTSIENILNEAQLQHAWDEQSMSENEYALLKETLHKAYMTKCLNNIHNSTLNPKLRTFKLFKEEFKFESYLTSTKNHNHTLSLFRFRISSHNLRIETGRYTRPKTPEQERKCIYCSNHSVENEPHFLLVCDLYTNERAELIKDVINYIPNLMDLSNEEKFIMLMSSNLKPITDSTGKYIYKCLKKRSETQTIETDQST